MKKLIKGAVCSIIGRLCANAWKTPMSEALYV